MADDPTGRPVRVHLVLIQPSKYDDDGYVNRHWRGVVPSNTMATLYSLSRDASATGKLGDVQLEITAWDEMVVKVDSRRLSKRFAKRRSRGEKTIICMVGVQTNQFPRAADMCLDFRREGLDVLMGGMHVSGSIAMSPTMPPELQELLDQGVILVKGEVEEVWDGILGDVIDGRAKSFYDIADKPDLSGAPIPEIDRRYMKRFAMSNIATVDAGRGCPYNCSFCTIINVQGKKVRYRDPEKIASVFRRGYPSGVDTYFFTDDNFARNPNWSGILDHLIRLREEEGLDVTFMMEVDAVAWKIPGFVEKSARAGCNQVFLGLESVNPDNLVSSDKRQNKVRDYRRMTELFHEHRILVQCGYILGFPQDTYDSILQDVHFLQEEVQVDQAFFFMLTPLPGSRDHAVAAREGVWMDPDFSRFDSFHETIRHPRMKPGEWQQAYWKAWEIFYSPGNMKKTLLRMPPELYWTCFKNLLWCYLPIAGRVHPMIGGFWRFRDRTIRRRGLPVTPLWRHAWNRAGEIAHMVREYTKMARVFEELWLQTRWQVLGTRDREGAGILPPVVQRAGAAGEWTRRALDDFWSRVGQNWRGGRLWRINPASVAGKLAGEARLVRTFLRDYSATWERIDPREALRRATSP